MTDLSEYLYLQLKALTNKIPPHFITTIGILGPLITYLLPVRLLLSGLDHVIVGTGTPDTVQVMVTLVSPSLAVTMFGVLPVGGIVH